MPMDKSNGKAAILMFAATKGDKSGVTPPTEALAKKKTLVSDLPMSDEYTSNCDCCSECDCPDTCEGCEGENCSKCGKEEEDSYNESEAKPMYESTSEDMRPDNKEMISKLISLLEKKVAE